MKNLTEERRLVLVPDKGNAVRIESIEGVEYFSGYGAVFNSRSKLILEPDAQGITRLFYEILRPGCFDRILQDPNLDVVLSIDHEHFYNLGRTVSGNLILSVDEIGLKFRATVPNTTLGRDTAEMIRRGDYTDCSFKFNVQPSGEKWIRDDDGSLLHIVEEVSRLFDVTICTLRGAYNTTKINVEVASRMYKELIQEREENQGGETGDPGDPAGDHAGEFSNDNPGEDPSISTDNDLARMKLDLLKFGDRL